MKNKFHDNPQSPSLSSGETELRIKMYRQVWLEGKLKIDSERLAEKMMDFETQLDSVLSDVSIQSATVKNRQ